MKFFGVVALAVLVALAAAQTRNATVGSIGPDDIILHRQFYIAKPRLSRTTTYITYPPKGVIGSQDITAVRVTDYLVNGTGGTSSIIAGGPGYRNVTIRLQSERGKGFNMFVEIYGI